MFESLLPIAIRAWPKVTRQSGGWPDETLEASDWTLVFDTETMVDAGQRLRVGCFRLLRDDELFQEGFFYNLLTDKDLRLLRSYAAELGLPVLTIGEFREVFYDVAARLRATIVGFNLPFDLARLAVDWKPARRRFAGGSSLIFWLKADGEENKDRPRLRVKVLNSGTAMYEFSRGRKDPRTKKRPAHWPGRFIDLSTLVEALTGESHSLESAARTFRTRHRKLGDVKHGKPLTRRYLRYLQRDVLVTEELLEKLLAEYGRHPLELDPCEVYSGASIAKAYLKEFGFTPPREKASVSDEEMGHAMAAFYGGRAEIHIRRELVPVTYVDVESTYATLFTLQRLSDFLRARSIGTYVATDEVKAFIRDATPEDLLRPEKWPLLTAIVELEADEDILPVRTAYGRALPDADADMENGPSTSKPFRKQSKARSIGVNRLSTPRFPVHYAVADVLASKVLTSRMPRIRRATGYVAQGTQDGLRPVALRGEVSIDPCEGELFKQVVEARQRVRADHGIPELERHGRQRSLKLFSNSGSYGIFAEFNRKASGKPKPLDLFCDRHIETELPAAEKPGPFCFPPLAVFSTAAARLLLALLEHFVTRAGGSWLCTDTDSMAIVTDYGELETREWLRSVNDRPDALPLSVVEEIIGRFKDLWPYEGEDNILKLEAENFDPDSGERRPLYGVAIAAKRFCLLNFDRDGTAIIRKRSEHGLGLFVSPHGSDDKKKRWIDEFWQDIVDEILRRPRKPREWHAYPVIGRLPVTTWDLLETFAGYNRTNPESPVRPFNFVSAAYLKPFARAEPVRLFAPFVSEPARAREANWYEHSTGRRVSITTEDPMGEVVPDVMPVKTYGDLLQQYSAHPEIKFANEQRQRCRPGTEGTLGRRHIIATRAEPYGKEGQALRRRAEGPGVEDDEQQLPLDSRDFRRLVVPVAERMPRKVLAEAIGMTERGLRKIIHGDSDATPTSRAAITAVAGLWAARELGRRPSVDPLDDCAAWLARRSKRKKGPAAG